MTQQTNVPQLADGSPKPDGFIMDGLPDGRIEYKRGNLGQQDSVLRSCAPVWEARTVRPLLEKLSAIEQDRDQLAEMNTQLREQNEQVDTINNQLRTQVEQGWRPDVCPFTGLRFFMWIEHHQTGKLVPTYGGPYDSYTIPVRHEDGSYCRERYDHDRGSWLVDEVQDIGMQVVSDQAYVSDEPPGEVEHSHGGEPVLDDFGKPIVYDTREVDQVAYDLTGDEGEEDGLSVLQGLARYVSTAWPGKTALGVLLEYEESKLATQPAGPIQPLQRSLDCLAAWLRNPANAEGCEALAMSFAGWSKDVEQAISLLSATPALAQSIAEADLKWLKRFKETTEDDQSYDVPKEHMTRLVELGALRWCGGSRYAITAFGDFAADPDGHFSGSLPLKTYDDHMAASNAEYRARTNGLSQPVDVQG